ncbi:MAG: hypothetical protein AABY11_03835 [archaeon]
MNPTWMILGALLLLAIPAYADIAMVDPVVEKVRAGGIIDAGSISPGESVELIFSRVSGYGKDIFWEQAILQKTEDATGVRTENSASGTDSLIAIIHTTSATPLGEYRFRVTMKGDGDTLQDETATIILRVENNLVKASLSTEEVNGRVNEPLTFTVFVLNNSSATIPIAIEPALPASWVRPQTRMMGPHSFETVTLEIIPRFAGPKTFDIQVTRTDKGTEVAAISATLNAEPTLKDRYSAGLYGFPFFTISLVSHYLVNAIVGMLL